MTIKDKNTDSDFESNSQIGSDPAKTKLQESTTKNKPVRKLGKLKLLTDRKLKSADSVLDTFQDAEKIRKLELGETQKEITVGLALSGGGIRSASFALGVIQAFCIERKSKVEQGLGGLFDYLSTVSGGGYLGGRAHLVGWAKLRFERAVGW